jgi:hypothetical protein
MNLVGRLSAVLLLATPMILVGGEWSRAETLTDPVTAKTAYRPDFHGRSRIELAQADTSAAKPPETAPPPEAKPQDQKPANSSAAAPENKPVFPSAVDPKYAHELGPIGRMRTCADQFTANKAANANAGMKWIDKSGGYYLECSRKLKG